MAGFCLLPQAVDRFKAGLKSGAIDPEKLAKMTSEERNKFFEDYVGKGSSKDVNALFESKLLLKNQQKGFLTWAKKVAGLNPEIRKDLVSRIERMDKVLDPEDKSAFMKELASAKLGVNVTQQEAKTVADLSKKIQLSHSKMREDFTFPSESDRMEYGRSVVALQNYVDDLKNSANKIGIKDFKSSPVGTAGRMLSNSAGLFKSLRASLDNSVVGRQGLKVLLTHPGVWRRNTIQSFKDIAHSFGGQEVIDETRAEVLSRPNNLNGLYRREKLDLGNVEEAYPTSMPERLPVAGKFFKASEAAFTAFQYRTRADLLDGFANLAEKTGGDVTGMGIIANGLTGRGRLGAFERASKPLNNIFFSPRLVMSNVNALTGHLIDYKDLSPMARKEAAQNTAKIVLGIAGILTMANAVKPGSIELDPRSSDFGKIRIKNTRFDMSGGMASLVTLAVRIKKQSSKSASSGAISKFGAGFGSQTGTGAFFDWLTNKSSPVFSVIKDLANQKDFNGDPLTLKGEVGQLALPMSIANYNELKSNSPRAANTLLAIIADGLGISTNTYGATRSNNPTWESSTGKEINAFKQSVGNDRFKTASQAYDSRVNDFIDNIVKDGEYNKLSDDNKKQVITNEKAKIQADIFKEYGFKYTRAKSNSSQLKKFLK